MIRRILQGLDWLGRQAEDALHVYDDPYGRFDRYASELEVDRLRRQMAAIGEGLGLGADWDPDDCMDMVAQAGHLLDMWSDAEVATWRHHYGLAGESS